MISYFPADFKPPFDTENMPHVFLAVPLRMPRAKPLPPNGFSGTTRWFRKKHWVVLRLGRRPFGKTIGWFWQKDRVVFAKPLGSKSINLEARGKRLLTPAASFQKLLNRRFPAKGSGV